MCSQPVGGSASTPLPGRNPADWDEDEVCSWLRDSQLTQFEGLFREQASHPHTFTIIINILFITLTCKP